jgi:hypothetical protein
LKTPLPEGWQSIEGLLMAPAEYQQAKSKVQEIAEHCCSKIVVRSSITPAY